MVVDQVFSCAASDGTEGNKARSTNWENEALCKAILTLNPRTTYVRELRIRQFSCYGFP